MLQVTDRKDNTSMRTTERAAIKKYGGVAYTEALAGLNPNLEIVDLSIKSDEDFNVDGDSSLMYDIDTLGA